MFAKVTLFLVLPKRETSFHVLTGLRLLLDVSQSQVQYFDMSSRRLTKMNYSDHGYIYHSASQQKTDSSIALSR